MPLGEESRLTWYFGIGQTAFERSTTGAMLERAENFSWQERKCKRKGCDSGALEDGTDCDKCSGTGYVGGKPARTKHFRTGYRRCPECRGLGISKHKVCETCEGALYISEDVNAFAHVSHAEGKGYTPDDFQLATYARVSRRLTRLATKAHGEVLAAYYGDLGARWGRTRHGRIFALYHLTATGARWAQASRAESERSRNSTDLIPSEILGVQAELEKAQPKRERRAALDACERQAREIYSAAVIAWVETKKPSPPDWESRWESLQSEIATRKAKPCVV